MGAQVNLPGLVFQRERGGGQVAAAALRAEQIRREQLATRREEIIYPVKAYGPWVILVAVVILILWGGTRMIRAYELRLRAIPRDARGDAPVLILNQGRQLVAYDPDRAFGPATVFGDAVEQPQLAAPDVQERVTLRDQTIDAVTRGLAGSKRQRPARQRAAQIMTRQPPPTIKGPIRVVDPRRVRGWLQDVTPQALRNALTIDADVDVMEVNDDDVTNSQG